MTDMDKKLMAMNCNARIMQENKFVASKDCDAYMCAATFASERYDIVENPRATPKLRGREERAVMRKGKKMSFDYQSVLEGLLPQEDDGHGFICNRTYNMAHIENLIKSLVSSYEDAEAEGLPNMSMSFPILVVRNDDTDMLRIVDGQHRFMACKMLHEGTAGEKYKKFKGRFPFYFTFTSSALINVGRISDLNSNAKNWKLFDYVRGRAAEGMLDYQKVLALHLYYGIPLTSFQRDYSTGAEGLFYKGDLKDGSFELRNFDGLLEILEDTQTYIDSVNTWYAEGLKKHEDSFHKTWKLRMTYRLALSLFTLYNVKGFDKAHFLKMSEKAAKACSEEIRRLTTVDGNLAIPLMNLYNYKKTKRTTHEMYGKIKGGHLKTLQIKDLFVTDSSSPQEESAP